LFDWSLHHITERSLTDPGLPDSFAICYLI